MPNKNMALRAAASAAVKTRTHTKTLGETRSQLRGGFIGIPSMARQELLCSRFAWQASHCDQHEL